jgi:hypothetical protein
MAKRAYTMADKIDAQKRSANADYAQNAKNLESMNPMKYYPAVMDHDKVRDAKRAANVTETPERMTGKSVTTPNFPSKRDVGGDNFREIKTNSNGTYRTKLNSQVTPGKWTTKNGC